MKVYVLTSGRFSDQKIQGVFSSLETLEAGRAKLALNPYCPELNDHDEYEVDEILAMEYGPTWVCAVEFRTGTVQEFGRGDSLRHPTACEIEEISPGCSRRDGIYVMSPVSQEHATKVATEKRQEWLRTNPETPASAG